MRQAFADGKTVTLDRENLTWRNKKLVFIRIHVRPTGGATKNTAEWSEPSDINVTIERAEANDREDRLDAEPETQDITSFDVHGTIKQPRHVARTMRSCMALPKVCTIQ